jgi:hypothetical protein
MNRLATTTLLLAASGWLGASAGAGLPGPRLSGEPKILIGDGTTSSGTHNGSDHAVFNAALTDLGTGGGQIEVLPGVYSFGASVSVTAPGVRIYGTRGATIERAGGFYGEVFQATGADFALEGLDFRAHQGSASSLIRIEGEAPTVSGCVFRIQGTGSSAAALDLQAASFSTRGSALVDRNTFEFAGAAGWTGLRVKRYSRLRVLANWFGGAGTSDPEWIKAGAEIDECEIAVISGNVFTALAAPTTASSSSHAMLTYHRTLGEGGHVTISGNTFDAVSGYAIVSLKSNGFNIVSGNSISFEAAPGGAVRLVEGDGDVVSSNSFRDAGGSTDIAVWVQGGGQTVVANNTFSDCLDTQVLFFNVAGATASGNWFESGTLDLDAYPIWYRGTSSLGIVGMNRCHDTSPFTWTGVVNAGSGVLVDDYLNLAY